MSFGETFKLKQEDFQNLADLIYEFSGIHLNSSKKFLLEGRLRERMLALGLEDFSLYYQIVKNNGHPNERQRFIDLLTTNETWFFREQGHFDFLKNEMARIPVAEKISIWSAACSSGQEPYSIAMCLAENRGSNRAWDIFATDISTNILDKARKGRYLKERLKGLSPVMQKNYFKEESDFIEVNTSLKSRVNFRHFNLLESALPQFKFDFIFCRNVLIYFDAKNKKKVVERLNSCLKPGGYLITGHAESLFGLNDTLEVVEPSVYRRR